MVIVRLARGGAKKRPFYSINVCDSRCRRDGRFIERLAYWQSKGAQLSETVARLVKDAKAAAAAAPAAEAAAEAPKAE